jgi:hypothetical protein
VALGAAAAIKRGDAETALRFFAYAMRADPDTPLFKIPYKVRRCTLIRQITNFISEPCKSTQASPLNLANIPKFFHRTTQDVPKFCFVFQLAPLLQGYQGEREGDQGCGFEAGAGREPTGPGLG